MSSPSEKQAAYKAKHKAYMTQPHRVTVKYSEAGYNAMVENGKKAWAMNKDKPGMIASREVSKHFADIADMQGLKGKDKIIFIKRSMKREGKAAIAAFKEKHMGFGMNVQTTSESLGLFGKRPRV